MELLTARHLYQYSVPVFIAVQAITDIKKQKKSEPEGKWWLSLLYIRNFLAHNVEIDMPDLVVTVGRTMKNLFLLFGIDLTFKRNWKCTRCNTNNHYYWNSEVDNPQWIPFNKSFDISEIFNKLKPVTYEELENGLKSDYIINRDMVDIFARCLQRFIVPLDKKWNRPFQEKVKLLQKSVEED